MNKEAHEIDWNLLIEDWARLLRRETTEEFAARMVRMIKDFVEEEIRARTRIP